LNRPLSQIIDNLKKDN
jgi:hypothetical protein